MTLIPPLRCPVCGSDKAHACGVRWLKGDAKQSRSHLPKIACDDCRKVYRADGSGEPVPYAKVFADLLLWDDSQDTP